MPNPSPTQTTSEITFANHRDHILARCGINRSLHRVNPGLYALGTPGKDCEVFVTANYTLSFDALRAALRDRSAYILVLDTRGVNVWCAAGKGTFGTGELVSKVLSTGLSRLVSHRTLILPQLGATGVSAHQVKEECGFDVEYGPVRAEDLPEYLKTRTATAEMRKVRFNLADRLVLTPVEVVNSSLPAALVMGGLYLAGGRLSLLWGLAGWLAAAVLFMALLPWLPSRKFSLKGFFLGFLVSLPFAIYIFAQPGYSLVQKAMQTLPESLIIMSLVAYYALNMTGSTPITNWTSVRREIFRFIPVMAVLLGAGIILMILRLLVAG